MVSSLPAPSPAASLRPAAPQADARLATAPQADARQATAPQADAPGAAARAGTVLGLGLACLLLLLTMMEPARAEAAPWLWPLPPPHQVITPFDAPEHRYGPGHRGIDIAAPVAGTAVHAVAPGTVRFSGMVAGRGVVSVAHAGGLLSTYEPVTGTVASGEQVGAGTELGTLMGGSELSHCPGASCLHLGARRGEDYVDPMLLLGARGPSVLLPWAGGDGGGGSTGSAGVTGGAGGAGPVKTADASTGSGTPSRTVHPEARAGSAPASADLTGRPTSRDGVHGHRPGPRRASRA